MLSKPGSLESTGSINIGVKLWLITIQCTREHISEYLQKVLLAARDAMLGPRELRSREAPELDATGEVTGGTFFERGAGTGHFPTPVKTNTRCFTLASSFEHSPAKMAPVAAGKVYAGEQDANNKLRKDAVLVRSTSSTYFSFLRLNILNLGWLSSSHDSYESRSRRGSTTTS